MTGSKGSTSLITDLECSLCGTRYDHHQVQRVCARCGKALFARYDLALARKTFPRDALRERQGTLWRYSELLPVLKEENMISLGEGYTPVIDLKKLGSSLGYSKLWLKDESYNATGSFKARGLCMAVSKAKELGIREACIPTAGNAGGALAAYASVAGIDSHIYMPDDTPQINVDECRLYGAHVQLVPGLISDAARIMNEEKGDRGWFDMSTLKEPYRLEGKKTMGFEVAEQFHWSLPDVIIYPTGGGTGLIGMWKAFAEMEAIGWIDGRRPKMVSVQSSGCAPIVRAFQSRATESEFWAGATTCAYGLRVPKAFADTLILNVLYESGGCAIAVDDELILQAIRDVARLEGIMLSPEGAATVAALPALREVGVIDSESSILLYNTGSGFKYGEVLQRAAPRSA